MKHANVMMVLVILLGLSTSASAVLIVGGDTLNGNFNSMVSESTADAQPFSNTVAWVNLSPSDNQNTQATRANLDFDGSRNVVMSGGDARMFGLDTGHTISAGEVYDIGYVWRDASAWVDASTEVQVTLFVTDDNTINGARTDLVVDLSGLSTEDSTYEEVDHDGIYTATAADAGKTLFVVFRTTAASGGFGRFDNFTLEASATDTASGPTPDGAAMDVLVDTVLSWTPGMSAATHDVYFGEALEDVNDATVPTSAGQDANSFDPGRLTFGTTYFWRVDEISAAPDNTVFKGSVWSFTAEPYAIMIPVDVNRVTASTSMPINPASMIVNGAGLDGTTHSTDGETMWVSSSPDPAPWLMFEFDNIQKLHRVQIWNANTTSELAVGWGIKDVNIVYSTDGENWTALGEPTQISQATGLATYSDPHVVDLGLALAKYVKIDILNNWGGLLSQYSVAEVQFYGLPVYARTPAPVPGSVVPPSATATWRAGREAETHRLSVSVDPNTLADGSAPSVSLTTNSVDLTSLDLQLDQLYYWRVDEVNEAEAQSVWQGPVWTLSTVPYLTVDNFDSYSNVSPNRPFQTWLDGFGYSADEFFPVGYEGNGTGSGVGHDIWSLSSPHYDGDIMEGTIVKSGKSMPLYFDNTNGMTISETEITFDSAQDWKAHGIKSLSVNIYGDPGNSGQLYLKINGTRIDYAGLSDALQRQQWIPWQVDLSDVTGLENVTRLAIGIDGAGASGVIYLDDIRLYPLTPDTIDPVVPSDSDPNLVALYAFEGNANDSTGNHDATVAGEPQYVGGKLGQAISVDGFVDYVAHTFEADQIWPATSVCLWVRTDTMAQDVWSGIFNNNAADNDFQFDVDGSDPGFYRYNGIGGNTLLGPVTSEWVHLAMSTDGTQTNLYFNGLRVTSLNVSNIQFGQLAVGVNRAMDNMFAGQIDDVRVYNRPLSDAEVAGLAGLTESVPAPF